MNATEYVKQDGTRCPYCGSDQIEGHPVDIEAGTATQPMGCLKCGAEWLDHYKLTGLTDSDDQYHKPDSGDGRSTIRIIVEGGIIQDISGIPDGIEIEVRDYDTDGVEDDDLTTDDDGHECVSAVWRSESPDDHRERKART